MVLCPLIALSVALATPDRIAARAKDWRNGPIVYQVFIDRFVPPRVPADKAKYFRSPARVMGWNETPKPGHKLDQLGVWSHELEFWGGDLKGIQSKLGYILGMGTDVLYLTPIFKALTNHRYDTQDYAEIAPELGNQADLSSLISATHKKNMRLMLDGVFNHIGRTAPMFQEAAKSPNSPKRNWFYFGKEYAGGYRGWAGVPNLPALRLENPAVRDYLWKSKDSIVRRYLRRGIDGWRLDVAFELGQQYLSELTKAAHETKPGSAVVGEISGYPAEWSDAVDGVFDFTSLSLAIDMLDGKLTGGRMGTMLDDLVRDAGIENLLKSWLLIDNHDTPRATARVPDPKKRRLVQALQFTLPGSPVVYYGAELGMEGGGDPTNRAPMRWDLATDKNAELAWYRKLIRIRKAHPALRFGEFKALRTERLLAFARTTSKIREAALVIVNPTGETVRETFTTRIGTLMSWGELSDALTGARTVSSMGLLSVEMKPYSVAIWTPFVDRRGGISPYDRVR